jgi:hypothetical protein
MGNTWYTNMNHFLDEEGLPALDMPRPAVLLMEFLGSIIEDVSDPLLCCTVIHKKGFILLVKLIEKRLK